jgi:NAD(P)-dependent dehydrogenase (short-subunit alcohol dehydrogenase family)
MKHIDFSDLKGKNCVVTGGSGVLGLAFCEALASAGVNIGIISRSENKAKAAANTLNKYGIKTVCAPADVTSEDAVQSAAAEIEKELGHVDILVNCAGGNAKEATSPLEFLDKEANPEDGFFGINVEAFKRTTDLNLAGTVIPSLVFGKGMAVNGKGTIINISSMSALTPLTKIPAYSAAKSAVNNFTEWLAVHLAPRGIRVNAIAPGFFLTEQNRFLLTNEKTGELTARGGKIVAATPMARFGEPEELQGALLYLSSDISRFITGIILPVDGGFNAYSGV